MQNDKEQSFLKKITRLYISRGFWISGPQFFSIVVQLVTLPIVLRSLPEDMFGGFQFAFAIFTWATLLSVGHLTMGASRGIATDKIGTFWHAFLYRLRIIVPLGLLVIAGAYFYDPNRGVIQQLLMLAGGYLLIGYLPQVSFAQFFIARQQFKNYFVWQAVLSVLVPVFAAFAAAETGDVRIYALAQFGAISLVSIAGLIWILARNGIIASYRRGEIDRSVAKYGFSLIPAEIAQGTAGQVTSFIIGPFFGFANLAVYSVASRIDTAVRAFFTSFYNIWYADFARKNFGELKEILWSRHIQLLLVSFVVSVFVAVPGFLYIYYAIPGSYSGAAVLYLILIAGFPAVLLQVILQTFLSAHLRHRALVFSGVFPSVIKIALIALAGWLWGISGIAAAVAASAWITYGFYFASVFHKEFLLSLLPEKFRSGAFSENSGLEDTKNTNEEIG